MLPCFGKGRKSYIEVKAIQGESAVSNSTLKTVLNFSKHSLRHVSATNKRININTVFKVDLRVQVIPVCGVSFKTTSLRYVLFPKKGSIAIADIVFGETHCQKTYEWISSLMCSALGIASTIRSQIYLLSMVILSIYRAHNVLNFLHRQRFSNRDAICCILMTILVSLLSIAVAIFPELPSFENYFTNGLYYNGIPLFVKSIRKDKHLELLKESYG